MQPVERRARRARRRRCATYASSSASAGVGRRSTPRRRGRARRRVERRSSSASIAASASSASLRPSAPIDLHAVVGPRVVARRDDRGRARRARCGEERDRRASAARRATRRRAPSAASPRARSASIRGPDSRVSRPMRNRSAPSTRADGATERDDQRRREIGVRVAADAVGAEAQHARAGGATASSTAAPCGPS